MSFSQLELSRPSVCHSQAAPALPVLPVAKKAEAVSHALRTFPLPQIPLQTHFLARPTPLLPLSFSLQQLNGEGGAHALVFSASAAKKQNLSTIGLETGGSPGVLSVMAAVRQAASQTLRQKWVIPQERVVQDHVATCVDVTLATPEGASLVPCLYGLRTYAFVLAWTPTSITSTFLTCEGADKSFFKELKPSTKWNLQEIGLVEKMGDCVMSYLQEAFLNLVIARAFPTGDQVTVNESGHSVTTLGKPRAAAYREDYRGCMGLDNFYFLRVFAD